MKEQENGIVLFSFDGVLRNRVFMFSFLLILSSSAWGQKSSKVDSSITIMTRIAAVTRPSPTSPFPNQSYYLSPFIIRNPSSSSLRFNRVDFKSRRYNSGTWDVETTVLVFDTCGYPRVCNSLYNSINGMLPQIPVNTIPVLVDPGFQHDLGRIYIPASSSNTTMVICLLNGTSPVLQSRSLVLPDWYKLPAVLDPEWTDKQGKPQTAGKYIEIQLMVPSKQSKEKTRSP